MTSMFRTAVILVVVSISLALISFQSGIVMGQASGRVTFTRTPKDYNSQTGAFTLGEQAYGMVRREQVGGRLCLSYDYFAFNAAEGQALNGRLGSPGQVISYVILNTTQFHTFYMNVDYCYLTLPSAPVTFRSETTLNWTSPESGQYALVFYTVTFYEGPVYLSQESNS